MNGTNKLAAFHFAVISGCEICTFGQKFRLQIISARLIPLQRFFSKNRAYCARLVHGQGRKPGKMWITSRSTWKTGDAIHALSDTKEPHYARDCRSSSPLRRDRPDGRRLLRQLPSLVRGGPRGAAPRPGFFLQRAGDRARVHSAGGGGYLPLPLLRSLRRPDPNRNQPRPAARLSDQIRLPGSS